MQGKGTTKCIQGGCIVTNSQEQMIILMADDDADDRFMVKEALDEVGMEHNLYFVENGEELTDYLNRRGKFTDPATSPRPGLILLDLNMPRKDGREALKDIKSDPKLKTIPVVVLTTSKAEDDICGTYDLGVNSFIAKPVSFEALVSIMKILTRYWFQLVELPKKPD